MTISGEGKNPTFEHIRRVGEEFQIRESEVIEVTGKVMEAVGHWHEFACEAGVPKQVADRIRASFIPIKVPSNSMKSDARRKP